MRVIGVDLAWGARNCSGVCAVEDGHVLEIYSYRQKGQRLGTVRLNDGAVSSVDQQ